MVNSTCTERMISIALDATVLMFSKLRYKPIEGAAITHGKEILTSHRIYIATVTRKWFHVFNKKKLFDFFFLSSMSNQICKIADVRHSVQAHSRERLHKRISFIARNAHSAAEKRLLNLMDRQNKYSLRTGKKVRMPQSKICKILSRNAPRAAY